MPKISYIDKVKNGFDDTEVTAELIQNRLASINFLLRGYIDSDNLLDNESSGKTVYINQSTIMDLASETLPVDYSMKFFSHERSGESVYHKVYEELVDVCDSNPAFMTVGGIQDSEMIWEYSDPRVSEELPDITRFLELSSTINKDVEIPPYFVPMTWGELYEKIKGFEIKKTANSDSGYAVEGLITSLDEFLDDFEVKPDEYVQNTQVNRSSGGIVWYSAGDLSGVESSIRLKEVVLPKLSFKEKTNVLNFSAIIDAALSDENGYMLLRFIPSVLCRVLP